MIGWIIGLVVVVYLFVRRADIVAGIARIQYGKGNTERAMKLYDFAYKFGKMKFNSALNYAYLTLKTDGKNILENVKKLLQDYKNLKDNGN